MKSTLTIHYRMFVTNNADPSGTLEASLHSCRRLLGDVNLFFLIYVAQEEQKGAGAENDR